MSISAVNAVWYGTPQSTAASAVLSSNTTSAGPFSSNEYLASIMAGYPSHDMEGFAVAVLDGASTTFTLNWIDGTKTLFMPPDGVIAYRHDPPAWTATAAFGAPPYTQQGPVYYPVNAVVLGSSHVQQAQATGLTGTSAPSWSTSGGTVADNGALTWKDLGAVAASTIQVTTVTAITNVSATITISAAGSSGNALVFSFRLLYNH